jgi:hypothetical protein
VALGILVLAAFAAMAPLEVHSQSPNVGVYIGQITPSDATGAVGSGVNILGSIYSPNSTYQVILGKTVVTTGKSEGYYVNANFTVPELPRGIYALILQDKAINVNYSSQFTVDTGYSITAVPSSIQEGKSLQLTVSVMGGQMGVSYSANVAVQLPGGGAKYSKVVPLGLANPKGTASVQVAFPDSGFTPAPVGSPTDYPGTYIAYFNQSQSLAQTTFNVNILDSPTYHRGDTVSIRATGYEANQDASIAVTSSSGTTLDTMAVKASVDGVISATWAVPLDAATGDYTVKITPSGTTKQIADSQTFTVSGYNVSIQTTDLAGRPAMDLRVEAKDALTGGTYSATSGADGYATLKLEKGSQAITVYLNDIKVGDTNITVTGDGSFTVRCQLTDLKVTVKTYDGVTLPFVDLNVELKAGSKSANASAKTGPQGSYTFASTLVSATYTIEASMYGQVFNSGNKTVSSLSSVQTNEVTIMCPSENVTLNLVGCNDEAVAGARVELVEVTNGFFYSATTDSDGALNMLVTFGSYRARVYKDNILIEQTTLQVFGPTQKQLTCTLYGIKVQVSVVDAFGNPIANANVQLNGPQGEKLSAVTEGNGVATFDNVIGGSMQVIAAAQGSPDTYQAIMVNVDQPTTVQVKLEKYIAFASMLVPANSLLTVTIIAVAIVLLMLVEIYLRRRNKSSASS